MRRPVSPWLPVVSLLALLGWANPASAGWICFKNDTKTAVLIQEVPDHPLVKRGKLVRLLPGVLPRRT